MTPRSALKAKRRQEKRLRALATFDAVFDLSQADPDKVRVIAYFRELVADGFADWHTLENGTIRLRFKTGELYYLEKTTITSIA